MPRHRHPPAAAWGGRRFGLPASAPVQARRRSLPRPAPVSASVRRHPRPGERSFCRSGGSQPLLAVLTTLSVCLGFAPTIQTRTRQSFGVADLSASTVPASFLAGGGSCLAVADRRPGQKRSSHRFAALLAVAADQSPIVIATITADPPDNIPLCRSSPLRVYRSGKPCAPGGFT